MLVMRCSAIMRSASDALHRDSTWVVPPRINEPGSFVIGPRWANDVAANVAPPPPQLPPVSTLVMNDSCRLANTAPFGVPVVPDVNTIATGTIGIVGRAPAGGRRRRGGHRWRSGSSMTNFGDAVRSTTSRSACERRVFDTGGDGPEPGRGDVQHEVVGKLWENERDDIALADALASRVRPRSRRRVESSSR